MPGYGMGYYRFFDPTMILVLIGVVLSMAASAKVQSTFAKYSRVRSMTGMTGAEAAKRLLNSQGIYDVQVRKVAGNLTDHYDPRNKTLNLSESVYDSPSVAAIGVAAHECGHAIQDNTEYAPLKIRGAIVPVVNIGTQLSWPMILLGVLFGGLGSPLVQIGILLFTLCVIFQLVTLPVEFNASRRALAAIESRNLLTDDELRGARSVLRAAAMTYVAALLVSFAQLLRLIILYGNRRRD